MYCRNTGVGEGLAENFCPQNNTIITVITT